MTQIPDSSLLFSLTIPGESNLNVAIKFAVEPIPMEKIKQEDTNSTCYQYRLDFPKPKKYPTQIPYSYSFDNYQPRMVVLKSPPLYPMSVNDTPKIRPESVNFHLVMFNIRLIVPNIGVSIISPTPVFWVNGKPTGSIPMQKTGNGLWSCFANVSADLFTPIAYKYCINGDRSLPEGGRSHSLQIDSPIGGKFIVVFDSYNTRSDTVPYITRPIRPASVMPFETLLSVEYCPKNPVTAAYITGSAPGLPPRNGPALLVPDNAFLYSKTIPQVTSPFTLDLGVKNEKIEWPESGHIEFGGSRLKIDAIAIRIIQGDSLERSVGVYLQLISLKDSNPLGDFGSLYSTIDFVRKSGLRHIALQIEKITDVRLIDPVMAAIPVDSSLKTVDAVRTAKISALWEQFVTWRKVSQSDTKYLEFARLNSEWLNKFCGDPFAMYTQYRLYADLARAAMYAIDSGVSLMLDVNVDTDSTRLRQQLQILGPYAAFLRVTNASACLAPLTYRTVAEFFKEDAPKVAQVALDVVGSACFIKKSLAGKSDMEIVQMCGLQPTPPVAAVFGELRRISMDAQNISRAAQYKDYFKKVAQSSPSAIAFDSSAAKVSELIGLFASGTPSYEEPNFVSPEKATEFLEEEEAKVSQEIIERAQRAKVTTFYLSDIIQAAIGCRPQCVTVQEIPNYQRFVFNVTASELSNDNEITHQIKEFVQKI